MNEKKIISIEDRIPKLKQVRRRKANSRLIFYLSIFFILIALIVYLQSPLSHIKSIHVTGHSILTEEEIIAESELTTETNIWSIKSQDVQAILEKHPFILETKVSRKFPSTVVINIEENKHVGYIENDSEYLLLLNNGETITRENYSYGKAPLVVGFSETSLKDLARELSKLPDAIVHLISEIHYQTKSEIDNKILMYMNDGFTVDTSLRSIATQMKAYPSIVSQLSDQSQGTIYLGVDAYFEPYKE